ncbi:AF4/FMR2 family member 3 isoform X4 [Spodoptera frugiperda]|uniref:AF4/FMR2 family member lilli n=1 Tax=Spodoptera frugiperda TaxID=7108 RepID=A0A9R0DQE7_SPOFR|nr:AF4/FMR2 family member 3 isoform X4 [Spodoptera frugiperda]
MKKGYDKWDRDRGGGSGGGGAPAAWPGRDRERDRERERKARAHQMSQAHAPEPDASSLFPAPFRVTGNRDRVSQQIQTKLGDYHLAQWFIDDPSKSIGICAEPPSPAPCLPSRRESEFKKPAHAPQNGVRHHRPHIPHSKSDGSGSTGAPHRPPPIRIPNGIQSQNAIDSSQPPIESILKEMKSLPTPLSVIAATPRKELENKFIFNPYTNKVQENPQLAANDLKTPLPKPGLDNRISNSRSSVSPDVVNKDLGLSESDDEVNAVIGPPISPIGSASPSSGSSSPSDSESESSSAESTTPAPAPTAAAPAPAPAATAPAPTQRSSWSLSNFAPPPAHPPDQTYDSGKDVRHALADIKGKPSPISEMSDSEASSPSPDIRRRRSRVSAASSDEDTPRHTTSPRVKMSESSAPTGAVKRGRPPKARASEERPLKKPRGRGRPRKPKQGSSPGAAPPAPPVAAPAPAPLHDSDVEPDPPPHHHPLQDTKTHIFRKVFTPKKSDECGGKGGKGGKGKGGKGKGQVTIIEVTAPDADDEERRNHEALARLSPPHDARHDRHDRHRRSADRLDRPANDRIPIDRPPSDRTMDRIPDRTSYERIPSDRIVNDRIPTERTSNDRIPDRPVDRISTERTPTDRASDRSSSASERLSVDRLSGGLSSDRLADRRSSERVPGDKMSIDRLPTDRMAHDRLSGERPHDRISAEKLSHDRLSDTKGRLGDSKLGLERLDSKLLDKTLDKSLDKSLERVERLERAQPERYVRAEADVGSGLKSNRVDDRLEDASSNGRSRPRLMVRLSLSRLRPDTLRAIQRPRRVPVKRPHSPLPEQGGEVAATNHERTETYAGQTPIYFSYFERLPADALSDEERDHKYYLEEATRLRAAAEKEQEPLPRVMRYLESVLCFVLTGRVLELELDTKGAFTIYRETIEYIKSIHSMPQRFRASPHDTFNKLDILSLRVQALLYLRMFKMYNREVKEYNKIVHEYQQKVRADPALAESVSPLSPTPSPAGSVGSVGSGSASSGYCSLAHSVPAHAHQALLLLNKYYAFLYVAHDLWEQADSLCRLRANRDLFIAVDRKCGPLSLSSTFRHLVQYVRHAISLLKLAPRD